VINHVISLPTHLPIMVSTPLCSVLKAVLLLWPVDFRLCLFISVFYFVFPLSPSSGPRSPTSPQVVAFVVATPSLSSSSSRPPVSRTESRVYSIRTPASPLPHAPRCTRTLWWPAHTAGTSSRVLFAPPTRTTRHSSDAAARLPRSLHSSPRTPPQHPSAADSFSVPSPVEEGDRGRLPTPAANLVA